jgi:hypothetical protein
MKRPFYHGMCPCGGSVPPHTRLRDLIAGVSATARSLPVERRASSRTPYVGGGHRPSSGRRSADRPTGWGVVRTDAPAPTVAQDGPQGDCQRANGHCSRACRMKASNCVERLHPRAPNRQTHFRFAEGGSGVERQLGLAGESPSSRCRRRADLSSRQLGGSPSSGL